MRNKTSCKRYTFNMVTKPADDSACFPSWLLHIASCDRLRSKLAAACQVRKYDFETLSDISEAPVPRARVDDLQETPDHSDQPIVKSQHTLTKRVRRNLLHSHKVGRVQLSAGISTYNAMLFNTLITAALM